MPATTPPILPEDPAAPWPAQVQGCVQGEDATQDALNRAAITLTQRTAVLKATTDAQGALLTSHAALLAGLGAEFADLAARSPETAAEILALYHLYSAGDPMAVEYFKAAWTLIDHPDLAAASAVAGIAGDDSLDLADSSKIELGGDYVLFGPGKDPQPVRVTAVLAEGRIRVTPDLAARWSGGGANKIGRHDLTLANGRGSGGVGGVYFSNILDFGPETGASRAVVVRRAVHPAWVARLFWRDADSDVWEEASWAWRRPVAGAEDVEFYLPSELVRVRLRLEISVAAGEATPAQPLELRHIYILRRPSNLGGIGNGPSAPDVLAPADGATGVSVTPAIQLGGYQSPTGAALAAAELQLQTAAGSLVWSGTAAGLTQTVPAGLLVDGTAYRVRGRVQDAQGVWSNWSAWSYFTAASTVAVTATPSLTGSPSSTAASSSAFAMSSGTGAHIASQWRILDASDAVIWDSGETTTALTSVAGPGCPAPQTTYRWQVRHKSDAGGWSAWSAAVSFTTGTTSADSYILTASGVQNWTAPAGWTAIDVVCIGGSSSYGNGFYSAGGGALAWKNNIPVQPGFVYPCVVGVSNDRMRQGDITATSFSSLVTAESGGCNGLNAQFYGADGGGRGGRGYLNPAGTGLSENGVGVKGGGAGGYLGDGGDVNNDNTVTPPTADGGLAGSSDFSLCRSSIYGLSTLEGSPVALQRAPRSWGAAETSVGVIRIVKHRSGGTFPYNAEARY